MRFGPHRGPDVFVGHGGYDIWHLVFSALIMAALAAAIVWMVVAIRRATVAPGASVAMAPPPPPRDDALGQLRMRYARGDVGRDEFLQASADLGGMPPPETPTS